MENIVVQTLNKETNTKNIGDIIMVAHNIQTPILYKIDCLRKIISMPW